MLYRVVVQGSLQTRNKFRLLRCNISSYSKPLSLKSEQQGSQGTSYSLGYIVMLFVLNFTK
uniref:Uncharacterized protein n=1 Tax=Anguilla anguilla TaxID=7936 RepID=A0A0E9RYA0_ANGAN